MASSSSSFPSSFPISSTSQRKYEIFLSFRGEDTRNTAVDFLSYALDRWGIYFFKDDEKLEGGKTIKPELLRAIEESRFAVVILSKNYASSTWCLEELVKIVDCEKEMGMTILPIFYNVNPSDVRKPEGTFAHPFGEYEKQFKEKVGTWRAALNHVANIAGYHVDNSPLSTAVESIAGLISRKLSGEFSEVTKGLIGIESSLSELESCLAFWLKDEVRFIGIWAMGGMGKTTLAEVAYKMFSKKFEACCFIDRVREKSEKEGELSLQKNLISQILYGTNLNTKNKCEVKNMIENRLGGTRILLVLDDVNNLNQLQELAGERDWFGRGSRIIITTRDKHLLETHLIDKIYEVKALKNEDALHLFCSKAFKNKLVPDEYIELSKGFLNYVAGHPLALNVLGSSLCKRSVVEWENEFEKLKEHPKPDVIRVLKISYDGLEEPEQEIFKDIACFFNHEKKDYVVHILKILDRNVGLSSLIDKSLLKISENNELWMHDLLRDMGRNIVRQESRDEPGKRSRLWHYEDIDNVLKNNTGTEKVEAMDIRGAEDTSIYHEEKEACWRPQWLSPLVTLQLWVLSTLSWQGLDLLVTLWGWVQRTLSWQGFTSSKKPEGLLLNPNAFLKMPNLKFLRIRNISLQLDTLPNSLRYIEYNDYPLKSLPPLPAGLVELHLLRSKIELFWGGMKIFENLKSINMAWSSDLKICHNFNGVQNLEELVLARCSNLRELHPSIGKLKKLKLLNLEECQELTSLPDKFEMESLVILNLTYCLKVKKIPEFVGNMKLLQQLLLKGTAITELPSSVECLTGLNALILQNCKNLVRLPNTICSLPALNNLDLSRCSKFDKLPKDLGNIVSLNELDLSGTAIKELPSSVQFLTGLTSLNLRNCKKIDKLPEDLGNIIGLWKLDLSGTAIKELPSSVKFLFGLLSLNLRNCKKFALLPSTICSLKSLDEIILSGCSKFDKLPMDLGNIVSLKTLRLRRTAIKELPSSVEFLIGLVTLDLTDCKEFVLLPNTICSLKSLDEIFLSGCSKFDKLPKDLGNIVSLKRLYLSGTAIKELPSSIELLIGLEELHLKDCKRFVLLPSTVGSLKSLRTMLLSRCPKFVNLPENCGNLKYLYKLSFEGTAIEGLPSSVGSLTALNSLNLKDCKNLVCLPSTICNLKSVKYLDLTGCSKIADLPENLGNMECLENLLLGGTAIKELPSSAIHLKKLSTVSFKGCQLSSSSLTYMPRSQGSCFNSIRIDLSDCNLSAIPSGIFRNLSAIPSGETEDFELILSGNDFVSLPESISQFSGVLSLYLDGCKSLRSLSNIPSGVEYICVDNCTSLERLPEPNDLRWSTHAYTVRCFNCFKLANNIQDFSNMLQGQSGQTYIIPGREIPKWFEKANMCDTLVASHNYSSVGPAVTYKKKKKTKIQLPGSGSGCDEWRGIVLCAPFLPTGHHRYQRNDRLRINFGGGFTKFTHWYSTSSEYGKVESHHLWLHSMSKEYLARCGFHQVELEIETGGEEVKEIGFRVV